MKRILLFLAIASLSLIANAQLRPVDLPRYPFINYDSNYLHYDTASPALKTFFGKLRRVTRLEKGNINIVHIGSSHVQAGTLPNTIRRNILNAFPTLVANRGMIFPYSAAANCNNPADYRIHCPQRTILTRNIYKDHQYPLGVCGIAVTAADTLTEMQVVLADSGVNYATSRIIILGHSDQGVIPLIRTSQRNIYPSYIDAKTDRYIFNLTQAVDSFVVVLRCSPEKQFTLNGILLSNAKPGITYHSIGVNGAALNDYLRCENFVRDMRLVRPDLVVFGIGINDAASSDFDTVKFRLDYERLIDSIRVVNPDCAFIFITNNDSFFKKTKKKYVVNSNGPLAREVFYRLAKETGGAVWDQFQVMGGLESMEKWRKANLAKTDRVHFTVAGYRLIGDLFSNALFQAINNQLYPPPSERYQYISY